MTDVSDDWRAGAIADVDRIRGILVSEAAVHRSISYSDLLNLLDHRFTRPKMRALCRTLDLIDEAARASGQPELAVLVVRESDGLRGQGWWVGNAVRLGYAGPWTDAEAAAFVADRQRIAFDHWSAHDCSTSDAANVDL